MAKFVHFDEAKKQAIALARAWIRSAAPEVELLILADLYGKLRVIVFPSGNPASFSAELTAQCGAWWTGEILEAEALDAGSRAVFEQALSDAREDDVEPRLKIMDRHRSRTAWFAGAIDPCWEAPRHGPPVVVFYSFKGGMGRSTLAAAFAIQRAREGERVCIVDLDLDSPGVGPLLSADPHGLTAAWGAVDFLIEHNAPGLRFEDYWHRCDRIAGPGEIRVMPSGLVDEGFADKLARVDMEESPTSGAGGLRKLLEKTRTEFEPDWILLDARTGITELAGQLLSGIAHLHVLIGSVHRQSWLGLQRVLDRLGRDRIVVNRPQADILLVQGMVPVGEAGRWAKTRFAALAEEAFDELYFAEVQDEADDSLWTVDDKQSQDAPHIPSPIDYDPRLASFEDIADAADALCTGSYAEIGFRISNRFIEESEG
jgi:MinD-like ATPase involved in chromosome partitioning or flagellar assembly